MGGDALQQKFGILAKSFPIFAAAAVNEATLNVQTRSKRNAPVDTGRLRSSIQVETFNAGLAQRVGTRVNYAAYQEFGTVKMKAQPFLFPAAEAERPKFEQTLRFHLEVAKMLQSNGLPTGGSATVSGDTGEFVE